MAESGQKIFLSYSREDVAFARELRDWLIEQGHTPWMDLFDIPAGARWPTEIDRALRSSDVIIGLMSPAGVASENVMNEWDWAIASDRRLVLLLIEPCEIPFHYVSRNYLDFTGAHRDGFEALEAAIPGRHHVAPDLSDSATTDERSSHPTPAHETAASSSRGSRLRRALRRQPAIPTVVGRERERALLQQQLDGAAAGKGGLILLGGEAGIGKTTLAGWVRSQAADQGILALTGSCYDLTTTPPYGPWSEIIFRGYEPADGLPPVPVEIRDQTGFAAIASEAALFEVVGEFFAEVSEHQPLLLVLEDLHWGDRASLGFLRFFARFLSGLPILIVATYRDDELTRRHPLFELMPLLIRESGAQRLVLERLDDATVQQIVTGRYALAPQDTRRLVAYLQQFASGNPLFTRELLESLAEQGLLTQDGGSWQLQPLETLSVPRLVREVIESRLVRLDDEAREALEIAAVIGQTVPLDLWQIIGSRPDAQMSRALEQAVALHLLAEHETPEEMSFSHALIRETLYEGIVVLRRRELHRQIAEELAKLPGADPDEVAFHFRQAGDQRAIEWLLRAAQRAERRYSWIMASERYEAALELVGEDEGQAPERAWLLFHVGRLMHLSSRRETLFYLERAIEAANRIGDRLLKASCQFVIGLCHNIDGNYEVGIDQMHTALQDLTEIYNAPEPLPELPRYLLPDRQGFERRNLPWLHSARDDESLNAGWENLAFWAVFTGRLDEAADYHSRVSNDYVRRRYGTQSRVCLAFESAVRGHIDTARHSFSETSRAFQDDGNFIQANNWTIHQLILVELPFKTEDVATRNRLVDTMQENQRHASGVYSEARPIVGIYLPLFHDGHWQASERAASDSLHRDSPGVFYPLARATLAQIARHRGDSQSAWEHVHAIFPAPGAAKPGNSNYIFSLYLLRAAVEIALDGGELDTAQRWLTTYGAWLDYTDAVLGRAEEQLLRAHYHHISGERVLARKHAKAALERATEPRQPLALIAIHRLLGSLESEEGRLDSAQQDLTQSLQLAEACELPFERALTLLELARLNAATGRIDAARQQLIEVRETCEPLGAKPTLDRVAELEAELERTRG